MAKKVTSKTAETDSAYFLKIVLYFVLGTIWLRINNIPLPIGLVLGLLFATHEHFQIDRKMEYVVLLIATMLGFLGGGLVVSLFF
jgi:hypothetical protein